MVRIGLGASRSVLVLGFSFFYTKSLDFLLTSLLFFDVGTRRKGPLREIVQTGEPGKEYAQGQEVEYLS